MKRRIPGLFNAGSGINPWGAIVIALFIMIIAVFGFGGLASIVLALAIFAATYIECGYDGPCEPLSAGLRNILVVLVVLGLFYIGLSLWSVIWGIRIMVKGSMGLIRASILIVLTIPPMLLLYRTVTGIVSSVF